jgi:hypothetical protein
MDYLKSACDPKKNFNGNRTVLYGLQTPPALPSYHTVIRIPNKNVEINKNKNKYDESIALLICVFVCTSAITSLSISYDDDSDQVLLAKVEEIINLGLGVYGSSVNDSVKVTKTKESEAELLRREECV